MGATYRSNYMIERKEMSPPSNTLSSYSLSCHSKHQPKSFHCFYKHQKFYCILLFCLSISMMPCPLMGNAPEGGATAELSYSLPVQVLPLNTLQPSHGHSLSLSLSNALIYIRLHFLSFLPSSFSSRNCV